MKTKVIFKIENDPFNVLAIFPQMEEGNELVSCYAHVGQHSSAHINYCSELPDASPTQYTDLKTELEGIGYDLEILNPEPTKIESHETTI